MNGWQKRRRDSPYPRNRWNPGPTNVFSICHGRPHSLSKRCDVCENNESRDDCTLLKRYARAWVGAKGIVSDVVATEGVKRR